MESETAHDHGMVKEHFRSPLNFKMQKRRNVTDRRHPAGKCD